MDDTEERRARTAYAEHSRHVAMMWTLAVAATAWGLALLGWP